MTRDEVLRAIKEGLPVEALRPGRPDQPYVGKVTEAIGHSTFWFEGQSGSESYRGKVRLDELSLARKEDDG